jgi:undecaprenyl-diphosphatase
VRRVWIYVVSGAALLVAFVLAATGAGDDPGKLSNWQALALGAVQGFTELLPISSSGHLILVPWLGDWHYLEQNPGFNKTFDVALHLGTLVAVVAYFWVELVALARALAASIWHRRVASEEARLAWFIVAATIPAAVVGAIFSDVIEGHLGEPWQIAVFLAVFAGLLWLADRRPQTHELTEFPLGVAIGIGIAQSLALMPGVSRSGVTITAGRFLGLTRDAAARFSFFLLVPIVLAAVVFQGTKDVILGELPPGSSGPFVVGTLASAATGLLAIDWLLGYVRRHTYGVFVAYRLVVAVIVLLLIAAGAYEATF